MSDPFPSYHLLNRGSVPVLTTDSRIRRLDDAVVVETPDFFLTAQGASGLLLEKVLQSLDGCRSVADLAEREKVAETNMIGLLEPFAEEGALIDLAAPLAADGSLAFLDAVMQECRLRTRSIFQQPFWQHVRSGAATPSVIFGWGIEFTHFVRSANDYMPLGVAYSRAGPEMREIFARHYVEEAGHAEIFYGGLESCGFDRRRLESAPLLPSTRALINHLSETAMAGAAPYAACFAVMQPSQGPADASQVKAFYQELRNFYPYADAMFDAFERHALIDIDLCHEVTIFEHLCRNIGVEHWERPLVLESIRTLAENFTLFFEGILDAYQVAGALVPRRAPAFVRP